MTSIPPSMNRPGNPRLAGLSVPPGSIAHLGLNSRSLSASLLSLKPEHHSDVEDTNHGSTSRRGKELDEISIDSTSGDSEESEEVSDPEDEFDRTLVPTDLYLQDHSPTSPLEVQSRASSVEPETVAGASDHPLSSSQISDANSTSTIPTPRSPPPTYDFATSPTTQSKPAESQIHPVASSSQRSAGTSSSSLSPSPRRRALLDLADSAHLTANVPIDELEENLKTVVPALLERVSSSSSERSLFRSFDEKALVRGSSTKKISRTNSSTAVDQAETDDDPDSFELSISEPPSPRSRSNSISLPGTRDKGKASAGKGSKYIKIVDRSGGEWRDLVERPDEEEEQLNGDEWTDRILKGQGTSEGATSARESPGVGSRTSGTPTLVNKRLDLNRSQSTTRVPSPNSSPDRPSAPRQTSTGVLQAGEPFARDAIITGWKIVGGETKVQKDRPGSTLNQASTREGRSYVEVERGKIGAFVGELLGSDSITSGQNGLCINPDNSRSLRVRDISTSRNQDHQDETIQRLCRPAG